MKVCVNTDDPAIMPTTLRNEFDLLERTAFGIHSKSKKLVIYGAGKAGLQLQREFLNTEYEVVCFIDDAEILHQRSIDGISIYSKEKFCKVFENQNRVPVRQHQQF